MRSVELYRANRDPTAVSIEPRLLAQPNLHYRVGIRQVVRKPPECEGELVVITLLYTRRNRSVGVYDRDLNRRLAFGKMGRIKPGAGADGP